MQKRFKTLVLLSGLAGALLLSAACSKKAAKVTPPNPPAPTAPTATLAANPSVIQQGQSTVLTWQTNNANEITVAGLGTLPPSGSRTVVPGSSTTYTLVANGPGGTTDASARVTVNATMSNAAPSPSDEDLFSRNIKDIFFDYNKADVRQMRRRQLKTTARSFPSIRTSGWLSKAIAMIADLKSTTSRSEPAVRSQLSRRWCSRESRRAHYNRQSRQGETFLQPGQ